MPQWAFNSATAINAVEYRPGAVKAVLVGTSASIRPRQSSRGMLQLPMVQRKVEASAQCFNSATAIACRGIPRRDHRTYHVATPRSFPVRPRQSAPWNTSKPVSGSIPASVPRLQFGHGNQAVEYVVDTLFVDEAHDPSASIRPRHRARGIRLCRPASSIATRAAAASIRPRQSSRGIPGSRP